MPTTEPEYKPTLLDRRGPDARDLVRAWTYGLMAFVITLGLVTAARHRFSPMNVVIAAVAGALTRFFTEALGDATGRVFQRFTMGGSTTPYVAQYSYQQTLVMQGRLDDALASFEAVIAEQPTAIDACLRAAELYARDGHNPVRAAELFRQVQHAGTAQPGQIAQATNRLVDLLLGPLDDPGRAQVELRKLSERLPGTAAAAHARTALARLKEQHRPVQD
jgi:hypothetical protein